MITMLAVATIAVLWRNIDLFEAFEQHLSSSFPRFAAISHAVYGVVRLRIIRQRAF